VLHTSGNCPRKWSMSMCEQNDSDLMQSKYSHSCANIDTKSVRCTVHVLFYTPYRCTYLVSIKQQGHKRIYFPRHVWIPFHLVMQLPYRKSNDQYPNLVHIKLANKQHMLSLLRNTDMISLPLASNAFTERKCFSWSTRNRCKTWYEHGVHAMPLKSL
jgi:hypothetical protein